MDPTLGHNINLNTGISNLVKRSFEVAKPPPLSISTELLEKPIQRVPNPHRSERAGSLSVRKPIHESENKNIDQIVESMFGKPSANPDKKKRIDLGNTQIDNNPFESTSTKTEPKKVDLNSVNSVDEDQFNIPKVQDKPSERILLKKDNTGTTEKIAKEHIDYANFLEPTFNEIFHLKDLGDSQAKDNFRSEMAKLGFKEDPETGVFHNKKTGTLFYLAVKSINFGNGELVLCFPGLGSIGNRSHFNNNERKKIMNQKTQEKEGSLALAGKVLKSFGDADCQEMLKDFFGKKTKASDDAMQIGIAFKSLLTAMEKEQDKPNYKPTIIGHSNGGGLAQCAAAAAGVKGVVFNSRPVGAEARKKLNELNKPDDGGEKRQNITAFVNKGDWVSSKSGAVQRLVRMTSFLRTSGGPVDLANTTYLVPKLQKKKETCVDSHNNLQGRLYYTYNEEPDLKS